MNGWVIYNGHLAAEAFLQFPKQIKKTGSEKNIEINVVANNHLCYQATKNGVYLKHAEGWELPSFVIFHDKDIALARQLELLDIPVYNNAQSIEICDNKVLMYQHLAKKNVNIPKTVIAPKIFSNTTTIELESFLTLAKEFSYPFIMKEGYGSFGEQVYLIHNEEEYIARIKAIYDKPFVLQEFVDSSYGRDIRIFVVGDKVVAGLKRSSDIDFRANVYLGSKVEGYHASPAEKELAVAAAKAVGATYCGVDLLIGKNGEPIICEVNTNAHVANILKHTGVNVAEPILDHIITQL
ncbi:ATP-grasp domain-containing protein [Gracilibacillus oryzae]|uniref:ATP-grasp domain-containing protein n=1 Tax=Gracilibacillus oryzae TaxID=1672701 RepID=UPI001885F1AE|nr:RimK family alpha-L-glutamate ligase [Gracilibacillus oryzae]